MPGTQLIIGHFRSTRSGAAPIIRTRSSRLGGAASRLLAAALWLLVSSGCVTSLTTKDIATGERVFAPAVSPTRDGRRSTVPETSPDDWRPLMEVYAQVSAPRGNRSSGPLAEPLAESDLIRKLVGANISAMANVLSENESARSTFPPSSSATFSKSDFESFVRNGLQDIGLNAWEPSKAGAGRAVNPGDKLLKIYLAAYFQGKYVDHLGTQLDAPSIAKGHVDNVTLSGLLTVVLDAVYDAMYQLPCYTNDKGEFINAGKKKPTAVVVNPGLEKKVSDATITEDEIGMMEYLAGVAGEQSKALAGMVFRTFQDVHLTVVVGASLSIGDNDTLAKLVDTFFDVSSRRATLALAHTYFKSHDRSNYSVNLDELRQILDMLK